MAGTQTQVENAKGAAGGAPEGDMSFEEYNVGSMASKFIALEVSDHEDDYNSSVDSVVEDEVEGLDAAGARGGSAEPAAEALQQAVVVSRPEAAPQEQRTRGEEKKKWSFISNNSSSKKRWSTLSFNTESYGKNAKRMSVSSNSSVQSAGKPSAMSLKRSSTGASIRSLLNKISLNDNGSSSIRTIGGHTNTAASSRAYNTPSTIVHASPNDAMSTRSRQASISSTSTYRTPLQPMSSNFNNRQPRGPGYSPSMDNVSICSQTSMSSTHSRWKFWKKPVEEPVRWNQTPPSSVSSCTSARSKSSFADLRKTLFSGGVLSVSAQELYRGSGSTLKHRLSQTSLKPMSSQSSLQTKTSHTSLKKFRGGSNSEETPQISLPIPDQASRDKIRIKLKHSTSLMSINTGSSPFGNPIITESNEYDEAVLTQLLDLCDGKAVKDYASLPAGLKKISDNNVYLDTADDTIYKVLPIASREESISGKDMSLKELQLLTLVSGTPGFVELLDSGIYKKAEDETQYVVLHMKNHGQPLSKLKSLTFKQVHDILTQCCRALHVGEKKFQFEHRYLTMDHILVDKQSNVTICDYRLARASKDSNCWFTRLDHPLFFQGRRDYNYVLQWMRYSLNSKNWHLHHPRTNLYWLYYIIDRLLSLCTEITSERSKLVKLHSSLDPFKRKKLWKRGDLTYESCGDLLCQL
ncbi:AaceriAFR492Wp [[Ashbya] aceris (nom. inval.)]|nr:AaceriAFR492Wp [[Ashbya] aceris (nom. inval.)]